MNKYKVVLCDAPWSYKDKKSNDPSMGGITYDVLSDEDLAKIDVASIADKDCMLFMWATMPKLKEALFVGEACGLKYITCAFTWVKLNPKGEGIYSGLGHWVNGNSELCLLFKQGNPKRVCKSVKQIQMHPRGRHSAKPFAIRDEIVRLM